MRAPALVALVITVHVLAISSAFFIQGCGTTQKAAVEPPTAPIMPPKAVPAAPSQIIQPPVAVEPAPEMPVPTEGKTYTIQNGDSLSKIAKRVGVSSRELAELNNIKDANKIRIGQKLILPDAARAVPQAAEAKPKHKVKEAAPAVAAAAGGATYVVQAGDTLSKIASKNGVKISALRQANPKVKGDKIMVGQKLVIPGAAPAAPADEPAPAPELAPPPPVMETPKAEAVPPPPAPAPAPEPMALSAPPPPAAPMSSETSMGSSQPYSYTVQEGENFDSIAKLFAVRKEEIMRLNNIGDPQGLKPGMKILIPAPAP